ncbi:MAG: glycosyltransferase [Candidatus Marinimicrobia bacterium]|nr:glycosyltransferase [Candidatus Neomarinimicrobiota bacterium]
MEFFILLILAVITALYAGVIFWARLGIEKGGEPADAEYQPFVSVIVAARNEEQKLPGLMEALMAQTYPMDRLEVIVVDDGSTDKTGEVLNDYKKQWPQLQSLRVDVTPRGWSPKKWALSQGVEQANGEIILTTDADCVPGPGWVWELSRPFRASDVAMAFGSAPLINPAAGWWWKALRLDSNGYDAIIAGWTQQGVALGCLGRNLAFSREAFMKVEGYSGIEHFISGDDDLLMHKMAAAPGYRIVFVTSTRAGVSSPPPQSFREFILQRLRFASKGLAYFDLPTTWAFRFILTLIYLANVGILVGAAAYLLSGNILFLVPFFTKFVADGELIRRFNKLTGEPFPLHIYLLTSLIHPFYIVVIGAMGNIVPVQWKGRTFDGNRAER